MPPPSNDPVVRAWEETVHQNHQRDFVAFEQRLIKRGITLVTSFTPEQVEQDRRDEAAEMSWVVAARRSIA